MNGCRGCRLTSRLRGDIQDIPWQDPTILNILPIIVGGTCARLPWDLSDTIAFPLVTKYRNLEIRKALAPRISPDRRDASE